MTDEQAENGSLPAIIREAGVALTEGKKGKFFRFFSRLLGVATNPELAQELSDKIDDLEARRLVKLEVAREVAKRVAGDPAKMERAIDRLWSDEAVKQENIEEIARQAVPFIEAEEKEPTEEVSDDWRRRFAELAGNVSEEEMQAVWARVLAGEFLKPGSFSMRTLRIVSEIDREVLEALKFARPHVIGGNAIWLDGGGWNQGEHYKNLKILMDAGIALDGVGVAHRVIQTDERGRAFVYGTKFAAMLHSTTPASANLPISTLTAAGKEIAKLLPNENERDLIEKIALRLKTQFKNCPLGFIGPVTRGANTVGIFPFTYLWGGAEQLAQIPKK